MKLSYLWRGLPGHPIHPPLTDATIGAYTAATVMGLASVIGIAETSAAHGWWLALVVGLIATSLTALTGFADWLTITWGSPMWWTATWHMGSMLTATVFFLIAALVGHSGYNDGAVEALPFILTVVGFVFLTAGGWLGGAIVYVHGMRVLSLPDEPPDRAAAPAPHPEKEEAEA
ncbi:MAG TPA: DUF2231 domain-containing protein [Gaiellaceae bacterium]|nr:DUF2231 domain-containing protein [Gaiellaceae bacterium]